ncbi:transmembrane protein 272-like [Haliotis asinina]|uniref:transmembrane protein 272-like n=1 Tax=Haliotis asinina TaxID=109174 RepID=UPI00353278AE
MASADMEKGYQQGPPPVYPGMDPAPGNAAPPPYSQAIHDPTEPPPTYESLYGRVKAAKTQSTGVPDFLKRFILLLAGTIGCTILIGLFMAIPVAMIVMGSIHLDNCPAERYIPIYLIVAGSVWSLQSIISLGKRCCSQKSEETEGEEEKKKTNPFEAILNTFMFSWFIAGNVWVYRTYGHFDSDPASGNYCDHTLYWFAFWLITATYIMFGSLCCCMTLSGCIAMCVESK